MKKFKACKFFGFTLAEVLITLGIIGIVAALTIPTLIAKTNAAKFRNQYKKTLSTLNQAAKMSIAKNDIDLSSSNTGEVIGKNLAGATNIRGEYLVADVGTNDSADYIMDTITFTDGRGYVTSDWQTCSNSYILADGSVVYLSDWEGCSLPKGKTFQKAYKENYLIKNEYGEMSIMGCVGFIDVNGIKQGPNKEVRCSDGVETVVDPDNMSCVVKNSDVTDIYPIGLYDSTIVPLTNAANYVLQTTK